MVPIKNAEALHRAVPNKSILKQLSEEYGFEGFYLFTTELTDAAYIAETRFFDPGIGIDEDPATGTAAGPLAGYLAKLGVLQMEQDYQILQGRMVNHPSKINVNVKEEGIWIKGSAVIIMEGVLYV